jgi:nucleoside-diphosphate-sugar epimerase
MKVLIIGANGYIGSRLYDHLVEFDVDVAGVDNFLRPYNDNDKKAVNIKNMAYQNIPDDFLVGFTDIIWLAGHSSVPQSIENPSEAFGNNVTDLIKFVKRLRSNQRFVYASSSSIYSGYREKMAVETDPCYMPMNAYDFTKIAFDAYIHSHSINAIGLRFGTVNGVSRRIRNELMINSMVSSAINDGQVKLANAKAFRPILAISDLVRAIYTIIHSDVNTGFYNLASFNTSIGVIASFVADHFNVPIKKLPDSSTFDFAIDTSLFEEKFDFKFTQTPSDLILELDKFNKSKN